MAKKKMIVVVNGKPGAGKTTLMDYYMEALKKTGGAALRVSSIDVVKSMIMDSGLFDPYKEKTGDTRKLMSDIKKALIEYNDVPLRYCIDAVHKLHTHKKATTLFVEIREPEEIKKFVRTVEMLNKKIPVLTVLVMDLNDPVDYVTFGNSSDDDVNHYQYDITFMNAKTDDSKLEFAQMIEHHRSLKYDTDL